MEETEKRLRKCIQYKMIYKNINIHIVNKPFELTEQEFWKLVSLSKNDPNICWDGDLKGSAGTKGTILRKKC